MDATHPPEIVARRLTIVDAAGRPRIVLGFGDALLPEIKLLDHHGVELASVGLVYTNIADDGSGDALVGAEIRLGASDGLGHALVNASGRGAAAMEIAGGEESGPAISMAVETASDSPVAGVVIKDGRVGVGVDVRDGKAAFSAGGPA